MRSEVGGTAVEIQAQTSGAAMLVVSYTVVYPEETPHMHLWGEAREAGAALAAGTSASGFAVRVSGPAAVPSGLRGTDGQAVRPIDFARLPFTVGGAGARCWWGRVKGSTWSRA